MKKGSKMTAESVVRIKTSKQNISEETRQKMREAKKDYIPWNKGLTQEDYRVAKYVKPAGWKHSDVAKQKMSLAKLGKSTWGAGLNKNNNSSLKIISEKLKGRIRSIEHCKHISDAKKGKPTWNKGLTKTDSRVLGYTQKMISTKQKQKLEGKTKAWNKGLTISTDSRIKGNGYKGLNKKSSEKILQATQKQSETMKQLYKEGLLNSWNKGLTKELDKRLINTSRKCRIKRIKYMETHTGPFISSQEIKFKEYLNNIGLKEDIDYKHQFYINNIKDNYISDFYFPKLNLIIEVDGIYWHNRPGHKEVDKRRNIQLLEAGYSIIRITDKEINENFLEVQTKIKTLFEPITI